MRSPVHVLLLQALLLPIFGGATMMNPHCPSPTRTLRLAAALPGVGSILGDLLHLALLFFLVHAFASEKVTNALRVHMV